MNYSYGLLAVIYSYGPTVSVENFCDDLDSIISGGKLFQSVIDPGK